MPQTEGNAGEPEFTVVAFDICSSSKVLEDLHITGHLDRWAELLNKLRKYLARKSGDLGYEIHKFMGDGWILLFDEAKPEIVDFLRDLSVFYHANFRKVAKLLQSPPDTIGLKFGMERGPLRSVVFGNTREYFGRALNVACRLQGAIQSRKETTPQYKLLVSRHVYYGGLKKGTRSRGYKCQKVQRVLKNILEDKTYHCIKITLLDPHGKRLN